MIFRSYHKAGKRRNMRKKYMTRKIRDNKEITSVTIIWTRKERKIICSGGVNM